MNARNTLAAIGMFIAAAPALAEEIERGVPQAPPSAKAVAGTYYTGDGLGYNVTLTLKDDGTYTGEWHGCLGKYGDAAGSWKLADKQIVLSPTAETDAMKGHLKTLDVLKYKEGWIFVRPNWRDFYDKYGVSRVSCFLKQEMPK